MKLFLISIIVSTLWHPISYLIDSSIEDYDKSPDLILDQQFLKHTVRWDSLFFFEIMENDYRYFKNHAFGYGLPLLGQIFQHSLLILLIIQKICNAYSSELLYKISMHYTQNEKFSFISALLFIFTPASVFYNSLYSESYFTFLVLLGILLQIRQHQYLSSILFAISIHFRSNGMFYILYSGFPYLQKAWFQLKDRKLKQLIQTVLEALPIAIIQLLSIGVMLYLPYHNYCHFQMDWCEARIPYAYGYIQKHFWDVGLLSSYKPRKWFFIFWGVQGLIVQGNWIYRWSRKQSIIRFSEISIVLPTIVFFFISAFLAHVNCSTRFFSTYITFYWAIAELLNERSKIVLFYLIEFNLGGLILFNNYLLWA